MKAINIEVERIVSENSCFQSAAQRVLRNRAKAMPAEHRKVLVVQSGDYYVTVIGCRHVKEAKTAIVAAGKVECDDFEAAMRVEC
jgi:hypothetical protein